MKKLSILLLSLLLCCFALFVSCDEKDKTPQETTPQSTEALAPCANGHTEVIDAAVAPTCTEKGKTEGKHCSVCNEVLVAQNEVEPAHTYDGPNDPTCNLCEYQRVTDESYFVFTKLPDGTYSIDAKDVNNMSPHVMIPATHNGRAVTSIGDYAFYDCTRLTSITIPDSMTSIGDSAFYNCSSLTSITIPDSVTSIGDSAFAYCSSLANITIPDSVTSIGDDAFGGCTNLIQKEDGVAYVDKWAIYCDWKVTKVTLRGNTVGIGNKAFNGCSSLANITIPDSVKSIGEKAFRGCSSLISIIVDPNNSAYHSNGNCLIETASKTLIAGCNSSIIPTDGSVTSIGDSAFSGRSALTSITIPDSVTSIDWYAFRDCSSLTSITIPDSVTSIGNYAFWDCSSLTSITIPDSVTSIGDMAFRGCTSLTSITIPDSVTSIGKHAFEGCSGLTSVIIPESVMTLSSSSFASTTQIYYLGTQNNFGFSTLNVWIYSEIEPTTSGYYWHYVNGVPTVWEDHLPAHPIVIPELTVDDFSAFKYPEFDAPGTIVIEAASAEAGSVSMTVVDGSKYNLFNMDGNTGAAAHGIYKLAQGTNPDGSPLYHYYIDFGNVNSKIEKTYGAEYKIAALEDCYIRWTFTVTEAGTYTFGSYMRLKNNADRRCQIQIDNQTPFIMHYTLSADDVASVNDDAATTQGAYMLWDGVEVYLEAGEHTITYTLPSAEYRQDANGKDVTSSWQWRTIYVMKKAA